jgi:hypothetical protein
MLAGGCPKGACRGRDPSTLLPRCSGLVRPGGVALTCQPPRKNDDDDPCGEQEEQERRQVVHLERVYGRPVQASTPRGDARDAVRGFPSPATWSWRVRSSERSHALAPRPDRGAVLRFVGRRELGVLRAAARRVSARLRGGAPGGRAHRRESPRDLDELRDHRCGAACASTSRGGEARTPRRGRAIGALGPARGCGGRTTRGVGRGVAVGDPRARVARHERRGSRSIPARERQGACSTAASLEAFPVSRLALSRELSPLGHPDRRLWTLWERGASENNVTPGAR